MQPLGAGEKVASVGLFLYAGRNEDKEIKEDST